MGAPGTYHPAAGARRDGGELAGLGMVGWWFWDGGVQRVFLGARRQEEEGPWVSPKGCMLSRIVG